jgi:hypothetical protein
MAKAWYGFTFGTDVTDITKYYKMSSGIKHCLCGTLICSVYTYDGGIHPSIPFSINLENYIKKALITGELQPDTPIDSKKYVYLKY